MFLRWLLDYVVKTGRLTVVDANGKTWTVGDGGPPRVTLTLRDAKIGRAIAFNPHLKFGEAYMDGRLDITEGDVWDLMDLLGRNVGTGYGTPLAAAIARARRLYRRVLQHNPIGRAKDNVAHHYDLDGGLYDLFLDPEGNHDHIRSRVPAPTGPHSGWRDDNLIKQKREIPQFTIPPVLHAVRVGIEV